MAQALLIAGAAAYQSYAQVESAKDQRRLANRNADMLEVSANDALARGEEEAKVVRRRAAMTRGSQRAALAAQGVDVNDGIATDLQDETGILGELDAAKVRKNAWREAWSIRTQAGYQREAGRYAYRAGVNNAIGTGLQGAGQSYGAYTDWYSDQRPRVS